MFPIPPANDPIGLIDLFGLTEDSPSNRAKREMIAKWAAAQNGSTAFSFFASFAPGYSYDSLFGAQYPGHPPGSYKCSGFTCAAAAQANADTVVTVPDGKGGTVDRCPTAGELISGPIATWRVLGPGETPKPGDIIAGPIPNPRVGATGHAAIVIMSPSGGISTIGAHYRIVGPPGTDRFSGSPTYRRFIGD